MKEKLERLQVGKVYSRVDVRDYTTYKVSAIADFVVLPDSMSSLEKLIKFLRCENVCYKVIGKGSNLLFTNAFHGVLIRLDAFSNVEIDEDRVVVGAGASLVGVALQLSKLGYTGLEFATGIPGTVGGAVVQNAGAYGSDMSRIVTSVTLLNKDGELENWENERVGFVYRGSTLRGNNDFIVIDVEFHLEKSGVEEIQEKIKNNREKRLSSQPLEYPSAGSVFRNPEGYSAGKLIEDLGFKGKKIGGAQVSTKHANYIINTGNATCEDIKNLILEIQEVVKKEYGIELVCEQEFVE